MKLIIITGPYAVGKMTVGQELEKKTELKLFQSHLLIDAIAGPFDDMPSEHIRLFHLFCEEVFKAYAKSNEYGLIFPFKWGFDLQGDWDYIQHVEDLFKEQGAEVYYVELEAGFGVRLQRNKTENRLLHKPSKRNIQKSEAHMMWMEEEHRMNSRPGEIKKEHYLRINNANMPPEDAAKLIKETFGL